MLEETFCLWRRGACARRWSSGNPYEVLLKSPVKLEYAWVALLNKLTMAVSCYYEKVLRLTRCLKELLIFDKRCLSGMFLMRCMNKMQNGTTRKSHEIANFLSKILSSSYWGKWGFFVFSDESTQCLTTILTEWTPNDSSEVRRSSSPCTRYHHLPAAVELGRYSTTWKAKLIALRTRNKFLRLV